MMNMIVLLHPSSWNHEPILKRNLLDYAKLISVLIFNSPLIYLIGIYITEEKIGQ